MTTVGAVWLRGGLGRLGRLAARGLLALGALGLLGGGWLLQERRALRRHEADLLARLDAAARRDPSGDRQSHATPAPAGTFADQLRPHLAVLRAVPDLPLGGVAAVVAGRAPWERLAPPLREAVGERGAQVAAALAAARARDLAPLTPEEFASVKWMPVLWLALAWGRSELSAGHHQAAADLCVDFLGLRRDLQVGSTDMRFVTDSRYVYLVSQRDAELGAPHQEVPWAGLCMDIVDQAPLAVKRRMINQLRRLRDALPRPARLVEALLLREEARRFGAFMSAPAATQRRLGVTPEPLRCQVLLPPGAPGAAPGNEPPGRRLRLLAALLSRPALCELRLGQLWPRHRALSARVVATLGLSRSQRDEELDGLLPEMEALLWTYAPLPRWHKASHYFQVISEYDNRMRRVQVLIDMLIVAAAVDSYRAERGEWPRSMRGALDALRISEVGEPQHPFTERVSLLLPVQRPVKGVAIGWPEGPLPPGVGLQLRAGPGLRTSPSNFMTVLTPDAPPP